MKERKKWTTEEIEWLKANYAILGKRKCAEYLKIPDYGVFNQCHKLGLNKTDPRTWTREETDLLIKHYPIGGAIECKKYINKSNQSINQKATRLNLENPIHWTDEQINILKSNYYEKGVEYCADLTGRSHHSVIDKATKLGIKTKKMSLKLPDGKRICSVCGIIKPLSEFAKERNGTRADCKICNAALTRKYQNENRDKVYKKNKLWRKKNKTYLKKYYKLRRPKEREKAKQRYHSNPEYKSKVLASVKSYRNDPKNKPVIRATQQRLRKEYSKNPQWRAMMNLRRRMLFVLAGKRKAAHSIELLGCTREQLKAHLERQFTSGMSWDNYGIKGWHIDHKRPCAAFDLTDPAQQRECFHYTNLQPLWAKDNLAKGDKLLKEIAADKAEFD